MAVPVGLAGLKITPAATQAINKAREMNLRITSAYRSPADDKAVGGTGRGYHVLGQALDVAGSYTNMSLYAKWAKESKLFRSVLWQVEGHFNHVHVSWNLDTTTPIKYPNEPINEGDKGSFVKLIQTVLGKIKADGIFGPKTKEAVKDFQKNRGLEQDGIVGPKTWKALSEGSGLFFYKLR